MTMFPIEARAFTSGGRSLLVGKYASVDWTVAGALTSANGTCEFGVCDPGYMVHTSDAASAGAVGTIMASLGAARGEARVSVR